MGAKYWLRVAERKLRECEEILDTAHLMNDAVEGFYGTKHKPSEEWSGEYETNTTEEN